MPKQALFGRLNKARPFHGVKMRWKDRVRKDMSSLSIPSSWYRLAQDRKKWYNLCHEGMERNIASRLEQEQAKRQAKRQHQSQPSELGFTCEQCHRSFRRSGDIKRHKCRVGNQRASRSSTTTMNTPEASFVCQQCSRSFRWPGDLKRHKCDSVRSKRVRKA